MATSATSNLFSSYAWGPINEYDEFYTAEVRKNLGKFHENLSKGLYSSNGPLVSLNSHWNYDGSLIVGRQGFVDALTGFVDTALRGVDVRDIYRVVDGRHGATLYRVQGFQSGPFVGIPFKEGTKYNAYGTELWEFDDEALLKNLVTVDQVGIIRAQMNGTAPVPPFTPHDPPITNPQTPAQYRALLKRKIAKLHANIVAGHPERNADLAVENVDVDENGSLSHGREAFAKLISGEMAGLGAFPKKVFYYDRILADGNVGVVDYVWQGMQMGQYQGQGSNGTGKPIRQRGMLYFEFDVEGVITKATGVYDEFSVETQVRDHGQYTYP